jgi:hypothetical protein
MSANSAVTVLRSPSIVVEVSCSRVTLITGAIDPSDEPIAADVALPDSAAPQSSQNADEGAFSAPHFAQLRDSGLPHAAQNFLAVVLSVPQFEQRIGLLRAGCYLANSSNSALASLRSAVSKPSVNQS